MRPRLRRHIALGIIVVSLIGWPLSAFTLARHEPQFVLALSWMAITLTAIDVWSTTDVRTSQDEEAE